MSAAVHRTTDASSGWERSVFIILQLAPSHSHPHGHVSITCARVIVRVRGGVPRVRSTALWTLAVKGNVPDSQFSVPAAIERAAGSGRGTVGNSAMHGSLCHKGSCSSRELPSGSQPYAPQISMQPHTIHACGSCADAKCWVVLLHCRRAAPNPFLFKPILPNPISTPVIVCLVSKIHF